MKAIPRLNLLKNVAYSLFILWLLLSLFGCKTPLVKKESTKSKTELTIPAGSVFAFEKGMLMVPSPVPVVKTEETSSIVPPSPVDVAKAGAIEKFYWLGGALFILACLLFYRAHVKAACFALAGALGTPLLAKFYSSDAAQYVALAALCIAGALFVAWHLVKNKLASPA